LRYPSVGRDESPWDQEITGNWLPVDLYFGGAEHSVLHLMYARFVTMALCDLKLLPFEEPFPKFFAHGLMIKDGAKMSKSRGNVVNPDEYIGKYGADTLRLYLMFMGPMDGYPDFRDTGIEGMAKFVKRLWKLFSGCNDSKLPEDVKTKLHRTIKKVTEDINIYHYNTAISALMELVNALNEANSTSRQAVEPFVQLIAPFAPHLAEEAWIEVLGNKGSVHESLWPTYDKNLIEQGDIKLIVQVDGKLRGTLTINKDVAEDEVRVKELALMEENVKKWTDGKNINTIFVPGKLVNFVTR
jgi:leucyl-tRNA synthetase